MRKRKDGSERFVAKPRGARVRLLAEAGFLLALIGFVAGGAFFGTSNLPLSPHITSDDYAQETDATIGMTAYTLAGGQAGVSFRGVTDKVVAQHIETAPFWLLPPGQPVLPFVPVNHLILSRGAVRKATKPVYYKYNPAKPNQPVERLAMVASLDLCADGSRCQEMVVASRGSGNDCWYERSGVGSKVLAREGRLLIRHEYVETTGTRTCNASKAPRSGWTPGYPPWASE